LKKSLWYGVKDVSSEILGGNCQRDQLRTAEFWAVDNVSFQVRRGECLGLIGSNGAGKTTLLRMLNGLIKPDMGKITMRGRVGALIALGTGFNPILTGRENIYAAGAILGLTTREISKKYEAIVEFAELQEFMDTPIQSYSSGMQMRLGFAVASQMEPDVLIIDEVLAVGDVGFRIKCFNVINDLLQRTAVIFVSHAMPQIAKISSSVMLMKYGVGEYFGNNINQAIESYFNEFNAGKLKVIERGLTLKSFNVGENTTKWFRVNEKSKITHTYYKDLLFSFDLQTEKEISNIGVVIRFFDRSMISVATCQNSVQFQEGVIKILIPNIQLGAGSYDLDIYFLEYDEFNNEKILAHYKNFTTLLMEKTNIANHSSFQLYSKLFY
jgi:lipopolysaccharide transport system ATP-binding protein